MTTPTIQITNYEGYDIIIQTDFDGVERIYVDTQIWENEVNDLDEAKKVIDEMTAEPFTARSEHALRAWQLI